MSETEPQPRWRRAIDIALGVTLVGAILIELTGGFVVEALSFEIVLTSGLPTLLLFAFFWLVRVLALGRLAGSLRSALKVAGCIALAALALGLINWAGSRLSGAVASATQSLSEAEPSGGLPGSADWNVLLISLDTLRPDHLGAYGYHRDTSPTLDRLAAEGALFRNQIASAPDTLVSHASMMTSTNPSAHGARMHPPTPVSDEAVTLAEVLSAEGFVTAAMTSGGQLDRTFNLTQGFDLYTDFEESMRRMRGRVVRWLERHGDSRWFLFLHTYQTHLPYNPHSRWDFMPDYNGALPRAITDTITQSITRGLLKVDTEDLAYIVSRYDGEIAYADFQLSRLFLHLREMGLWDRTIVIVTSDHGEEFGEHERVATHSYSLYDELLRVPLIVRIPGQFEGVQIEAQTRSIDLAPTVLDVLGIAVPESMLGVSLLPRLDGRETGPGLPAVSERTARSGLLSWRTDDAKLIYPKQLVGRQKLLGRLGFMSARRYRLTQDERRLFDLKMDPGETEDVFAARAWRGRALLRELERTHVRDLALAPTVGAASVDQELRDQLKALGYIQ